VTGPDSAAIRKAEKRGTPAWLLGEMAQATTYGARTILPENRRRAWMSRWERHRGQGERFWLGPMLARAGWTPETVIARGMADEASAFWRGDRTELDDLCLRDILIFCRAAAFLRQRGFWAAVRSWVACEGRAAMQAGRAIVDGQIKSMPPVSGVIFRSAEARFIGLSDDADPYFGAVVQLLDGLPERMLAGMDLSRFIPGPGIYHGTIHSYIPRPAVPLAGLPSLLSMTQDELLARAVPVRR